MINYYTKTYWQILTQTYGSAWPKVLPYCLVNVTISAVAQYLLVKKGINLDLSNVSHGMMNMLVAFLLVTRISISVSRYNDCRAELGKMMREIREMLQYMVILTRQMQEPDDKAWRNETTYRAICLLQSSMAVLDYPSLQVPAWKIPELDDKEQEKAKESLEYEFGLDKEGHTEYDASMRVPPLMAFQLRWCLDTSEERLSAQMNTFRAQNSLYKSVDDFMGAYYAITKLTTTQLPFPLVQMTRTFLLFYIFTVPLALLSDVSSPYMHLVVIFFLTFGYIGLEVVSVELDDPFGDDPNDFNNLAMAQVVVEDAFLMIKTIDGEEYCDKLRARLNMNKDTVATPATEESWLLSKP
jgi:predicted membrane chloride channel (bestrophin family)